MNGVYRIIVEINYELFIRILWLKIMINININIKFVYIINGGELGMIIVE